MTLPLSHYTCSICCKRLILGLYIGLTSNIDKNNIRFCYDCQTKTYGLNFWKTKKIRTKCYYCELDLYKKDLFQDLKYYLFTDMADGSQIPFCRECFEENSVK